MACSSSLLPPLSSTTAGAPAFRSRNRSGTITFARPSSLKAFFPSSGDLRPQLDENPEAIISGEWTQNFSLLSYDDLLAYLRSKPPAKKHVGSTTPLQEVMSTTVRAVRAEQSVGEIADHFEFVSGLPVVDDELRCLGVVCKNDLVKANHKLNSKVAEIMSSPAITLTPEKTVKDAAALMLKMKIHRLPILNQQNQVIDVNDRCKDRKERCENKDQTHKTQAIYVVRQTLPTSTGGGGDFIDEDTSSLKNTRFRLFYAGPNFGPAHNITKVRAIYNTCKLDEYCRAGVCNYRAEHKLAQIDHKLKYFVCVR